MSDAERIDALEAVRNSSTPGAWSAVLLALLQSAGDGRTIRDVIDAAVAACGGES